MATKVDLATSIRAYDDSLGVKQLLNRTKAELEDMLEQMQEQYNGTDVRTPNEERAELTRVSDDGDGLQGIVDQLYDLDDVEPWEMALQHSDRDFSDGDDERGLQAVVDRNALDMELPFMISPTSYTTMDEELFQAQLAQIERTQDELDIAATTETEAGLTIDLRNQKAVVLENMASDLGGRTQDQKRADYMAMYGSDEDRHRMATKQTFTGRVGPSKILPAFMSDVINPHLHDQVEFSEGYGEDGAVDQVVEMQAAIENRRNKGKSASYKKNNKAKRRQAKASRRANRR